MDIELEDGRTITVDCVEPKLGQVFNMLVSNGPYDGGHHKQWVIDQCVRIILGNDYQWFVEWYSDGGNYTWDEGIAP